MALNSANTYEQPAYKCCQPLYSRVAMWNEVWTKSQFSTKIMLYLIKVRGCIWRPRWHDKYLVLKRRSDIDDT